MTGQGTLALFILWGREMLSAGLEILPPYCLRGPCSEELAELFRKPWIMDLIIELKNLKHSSGSPEPD
jgi:hypothetical protein